MIILRSRVQGRGKFIAKPAALTKQFTVMLEILKTYECGVFVSLAKLIYQGARSGNQ